MAHISAELQEAADKLGFAIRRISKKDADALRRKLAVKYSISPEHLLSYQHVPGAESIHDPAAWSWLSSFVGQSEVLFIFNQPEDPDVLIVPSGKMIVPLLAQTTGFVFYLAPPDASYLLCFDDHDCLIGLGGAADWIRQLKSKGDTSRQQEA